MFQFRLRADGNYEVPYASKAVRKMYRIKHDAVRNKATLIFEAVHPDNVDEHLASIYASAKNLTPWHNEYRLKFEGEPDFWLLGKAVL